MKNDFPTIFLPVVSELQSAHVDLIKVTRRWRFVRDKGCRWHAELEEGGTEERRCSPELIIFDPERTGPRHTMADGVSFVTGCD